MGQVIFGDASNAYVSGNGVLADVAFFVIYFIRAYTKGSTAEAGNIDTQIDNLLHGKTLTITGRSNFYTAREADFENTEYLGNGEPVYMAGAFYRIRC